MSDDLELDDIENTDDAADTLLKRWKQTLPDASPKQSDPPGAVADTEEEDEEDTEEAPSEDEKASEATLADDEHEVEIEPGRRLKVADLKALAVREAEIASKHAEVTASVVKAAEEQMRHSTAVNALLDRARQRWEPFSKVDFLVAQKELTSEEFASLRAQANAAYTDVQYLESELSTATKAAQEKTQQAVVQAAQECVKVLVSPDGIKDWGPKVYNDLRTYALGAGIEQNSFNQIVSPAAFKVLHKAMLYDKAQKAAKTKLVKAPKNVNQTTTGGNATQPGANKLRTAMANLRKSGDTADAAEALLARWAQ